MRTYKVEHCKGIAGINDDPVEAVTVEAESEKRAIELSGLTPDDPDAPNKAGRYSDYVHAYEIG